MRREPDLLAQVKLWWCLLVFLLNVPGYVALRIWVADSAAPARLRRTSLTASSSDSRSSVARSSPVSFSIRSRRWRSVLAWMKSLRGSGGPDAAVGEVLLERAQQLRLAALVVVEQTLDRLAQPVVRRIVQREVHEVAVGAQRVVGQRAAAR